MATTSEGVSVFTDKYNDNAYVHYTEHTALVIGKSSSVLMKAIGAFEEHGWTLRGHISVGIYNDADSFLATLAK